MNSNKLIIFSAPSGSGKSTIVNELLKEFSQLEFSISATSRAPRGSEQSGVEYFFMSNEEFGQRVERGDFVEWEEVYAGTCYGTLRSEMERIWAKGNVIIFDVDVVGGLRLKSIFGEAACALFIMPPSVEELRRRLEGRATDSAEVIERRVAKAAQEIARAEEFDAVVVNDDLALAVGETSQIVRKFIAQ
ncbi:MAG: guanylate kinase [Rikenellaceae bacterium]